MGDPFVDAARDSGREQTKQFWWQQIQNFIYPALALGVLFVFWRMVKSTSAESLPASVKVSGDGDEGDGQSMTATGGFRPEWGRSQPMVLTPDMLNKLVQENPENFTQAIQSWLGRDARPES